MATDQPTETHASETPVAKDALMQKLVDRSRRNFLFKLSLALNGIVGAALAVPILGYLFGPVKKDLPSGAWIGLGSLEQFPEGETRLATFRNPSTTPWDGQTGEVSCWVRRVAGKKFQVFAINCAHLGCPVRWFEESKLFMCPCHGGAYYQDGSRASGPPERGLFEYEYKIVNNTLSIDVHGLPTLATEARLQNPLIQIQGADGKKTGGCGCQG
ncbi:MAG TPA: Rieske 2Fe-2S domain-containing protein [Granulicella sp.]|jgi:menaquinol-cytochrome c reductase iron-sulfur subunit|nr:Rieske 2Fe-2S domain-containing protein [Granulicella sp.]